MANFVKSKLFKILIIVFAVIILIAILAVIIISKIFFSNNIKQAENNNENIIIENNYTTENKVKENFIEIKMPKLVGKSTNDVTYYYVFTNNVIQQLKELDTSNTVFDLDLISNINDGTIQFSKDIVSYGSNYIIVKQEPLPEENLKLIYNNDDNTIGFEPDIFIYTTENPDEDTKIRNIKVSKYRKSNSGNTSNKNNSTPNNSGITTNKKYIHTAQSGCVLLNPNSESESVRYKYKCDYCGAVGSSEYACYPLSSGGTYSSSYTCHTCKKTNRIQISTIEQSI